MHACMQNKVDTHEGVEEEDGGKKTNKGMYACMYVCMYACEERI